MLDKPSKGADMADTILAEMSGIVRLAAEPVQHDDTVKAMILRACRRTGLPYRRTRTFWHREPCAVRADEADRLRALELRLLAERRGRLETELSVIKARLAEKDAGVGVGAETESVPAGSARSGVDWRGHDAPGALVRTAGLNAGDHLRGRE